MAELYLLLRTGNSLPPGFLADLPLLDYAVLRLDGPTSFPDAFMANSPELRSLVLTAEQLETFPDRFLTQAPQLHRISLGTPNVNSVPEHVWELYWNHSTDHDNQGRPRECPFCSQHPRVGL